MLVPLGSARAEVYDCGGYSNFFDGKYQQNSSRWEGAYAQIVTQYGAVCDTDTSSGNKVAVWTMITQPNVSGWVQVGYIRHYGTCIHYFEQTEKSYPSYGPSTYEPTGCLNTGNTHGYGDHYVDNCTPQNEPCMQTRIDGNFFTQTSWDPANYWGDPRWQPQWFGEANYLQSDMPGNSAHRTDFGAMTEEDMLGTDEDAGCTLTSANDGSGTRTKDGEHWYLRDTGSCPSFSIFTDTAGL